MACSDSNRRHHISPGATPVPAVRALVATALSLMLFACSKTPTRPPEASPQAEGKPMAPKALDPRADPANPLSKCSVYFDSESLTIKMEYQAIIQAHAGYLLSHAKLQMRLEGHTDERGSREYNVALGQRRAESVLGVMSRAGAPVERIEAVSWGEENPRSIEHDKAAWDQNRRVDVIYSDER